MHVYMKALIRKELGHFFNNPFGFIVVTVFALFANFLFVKDVFVVGTVSMRQFFVIAPWVGMVFIPALAMRSLADERKSNTIEVLRTLPVSEFHIVLSKTVALSLVSAMGLFLTMGLPISLSFIASSAGSALYLPEVIIGYVGLLMYFTLGISITIFFSSMTSNQVVAFLLGSITLFILNLMGTDFMATVLPKIIQDALVFVSPINHLDTFVKGTIDVRSLFYFISVPFVFLLLTVLDLEKRT